MSNRSVTPVVLGGSWVLVALLGACGGGGSGTPSVCEAYVACLQTTAAAAGDSTLYDQAKSAYGSSSPCHSSSQAQQLCDESCQQGLDALKSSGQSCESSSSNQSGSSDGGSTATSNGPPTGSACVSTNLCVSSAIDCSVGERCNTELDPPRCQALYCGANGTPCGDDRGDAYALCATQVCTDGVCGGGSSVPPPPSTPLDCRGYVTCTESCADASCDATCTGQTSSSVTNSSYTGVYDQALGCIETYCLGTTSAPYKCAVSSDGMQITEIGGGALAYGTNGVPTSPCAICLDDASAALFGAACVAPSGADCDLTTGSAAQLACAAALAACT